MNSTEIENSGKRAFRIGIVQLAFGSLLMLPSIISTSGVIGGLLITRGVRNLAKTWDPEKYAQREDQLVRSEPGFLGIPSMRRILRVVLLQRPTNTTITVGE